MRTQGYLHVEAHGAFSAICAAHGCLIDLGEFAIERMNPAGAQVWRKGRYDFSVLDFFGEWRVPVTIRTDDAGTIPDEARRMLENVGSYLDLRVYPEQRATDDPRVSGGGGHDQQQKYREIERAGSAGIEQGSRQDSQVLAGVGG